MLVPWLRMGGADKFNLDLCRMLRERGWGLSIACSAPGRDDWRDLFEGLTSDLVMPHTFLHWSDYPPLLRSLIETRRPGVVLVSNSELAYSLVPYFRAFCPEPVYLDYVHMEEEDWKSGGHARHSAGVCDQLDMTLTTSEHLRSWLLARGAQADRVRSLPIGVDHRSWVFDAVARDRARALLGVAPGATVILHAGRVCEQKQPRVLGRTLRELANRGRRFVAMVAGDGEDLPWLRRYVEEHGLAGHVRVLGAQSPDQVRELMAASDIFFLPSKWEGVALVLYEAMASGVVFVGTRVGGQGEVAGADEAVLVAFDDHESDQARAERFAREIESLMDDPGRCERMKIAARARVESSYTHDHLVGGFLGAVTEARRLQRVAARQRLTPGLAREIAVRAIELVRLEWQVGQLWIERKDARSANAGLHGTGEVEGSGGGSPRMTGAAVRRMLRALRSVAGGRSG
ncbi:MAG TPA: glycosyltransferase family 4 protein, partial [Phycisphaerales bacterium]|nr:glycosyltransferase family 4 protein [Phycisphaerales bacterium]